MKNINYVKTKKIRLLLCEHASNLEGGISAVVVGLEEGFRNCNEIEFKRINYAKTRLGQKVLQRIISEVSQLFYYIFELYRYKPDVVLVESSFDKKTVFRDVIHLSVTKFFNTAFILHAHGGEWHLIKTWNIIWQKIASRLITNCDCIVVTSTEEFDIIKGQFKEKVNVEKIFNPLVMPSLETHMKNDNKLHAIFASRLIASKGILDLIEAVGEMNFHNFTLKVFGNGPLKTKAIAMVKELGIDNIISFHGQIPLPELIREYKKSDVFVFPSYHLEGFPMALFFAVASGLPILATKVRPLPEYLTEPDNCLWIEPRNPTMLAKQLVKILTSTDLRTIQSKSNKEVAKLFTPEVVAHRFITLFKVILN